MFDIPDAEAPQDARRRFRVALADTHHGVLPMIAPGAGTPLGRGGARIGAGWGGARLGAGRPRKAVIQHDVPDVLRWYCVHTSHGLERTADIEIRLSGLVDQVFTPMLWRAATLPRREASGAIRMAKPERVTSLFARFMFVRFSLANPCWHRLKRLDGVDRVMGGPGAPGTPAAVPDVAIARIWALPGMSSTGCVYPQGQFNPTTVDAPLEVGTVTRILTGSLADHEGVCDWSDGKRTRLLMDFLGRPVSVTVARREVVAA